MADFPRHFLWLVMAGRWHPNRANLAAFNPLPTCCQPCSALFMPKSGLHQKISQGERMHASRLSKCSGRRNAFVFRVK